MEKTIDQEFPYFEEIKRHLSITWDDDTTNKTIIDYILEGKRHITTLCGEPSIDFNIDIDAKKLLKEYCRYARNYSIEAFNHNFADDILRLQINYAIKDNDKTSNL